MKRIIISRTDAIGDVVLTLPMSGILKKHFPEAEIIFFGKTYTKPVITLSADIDGFINYDEFNVLDKQGRKDFLKAVKADAILHVFPRRDIAMAAKDAGIKTRIGTSHRLYNWFACNRLVNFTRKNSELHESQLNMQLLKPLIKNYQFTVEEIGAMFNWKLLPQLSQGLREIVKRTGFILIIHPKSHGSAREWGLENYKKLIEILDKEKIKILITGSAAEKKELQGWISSLPATITDLTGQLSLIELIALLGECNGMIAGSTGPLHIAAALGKNVIGIYPSIRPMHAGRWKPLGKNATAVSLKEECNECLNAPEHCSCLKNLSPDVVAGIVRKWLK